MLFRSHRCPLQCPYCSNPLDLQRAASELDTESWKRIFDEAAALGVLHIHFSGGEPAVRKDLEILVAHCSGLGLYTNLITSAVLIDRARLLALAKAGLNHVAFTVRDIHEVFGGGMHMSRTGWDTQLGPGRHPISSAYFWYFKNPAGGLIEYYADEDQLDAHWEPREFEPGPTMFAEWAIEGGIDGNTRRQKNAGGPEGKFLTEKR